MNHEDKYIVSNNHNHIWLLSISALLIAFNWHYASYSSTYLLFWCAALSIAWKKKEDLELNSSLFATIIGLILISWMLFRGAVSEFSSNDLITRFYPLISIAGICLLASKVKNVFQYWREIIIVSLTGIPWEYLFDLMPITEQIIAIDAKISRLMLWYVGFDVHQVGDLVILPSGSIRIMDACSSFSLLGLMWQSCLVAFLYFAIAKNHKLILGLSSTLIAFVVNGVRLCLLALLVANKQDEAFEYWHGAGGAEVFTTIAILLLGGVYWILTRDKETSLDVTASS